MPTYPPGVLADHQIEELITGEAVKASSLIETRQIQPNSLDLRLGRVAYRVRCSFVPQDETVQSRLSDLEMYSFHLEWGAVLERGQTYIIPLQEHLTLPDGLRARANPKSSTGRLDVFTRTLTDHNHRFEDVPEGYTGPLYLEVFPRTFPIKVRTGDSLNQLRFFSGDTEIPDDELRDVIATRALLYNDDGSPKPPEEHHVENGLFMGLDLAGTESDSGTPIIGYRAQRNSEIIDLQKIGQYDLLDFWDPIAAPGNRPVILEPEEFYLFASAQRVAVPPELSAEMVPYDTAFGELRTHYAGFFDSGFGVAEPSGARVVLEVRSHDVPFQVTHNQRFFRLQFQRNSAAPRQLYGGSGSHYQRQGLALSKHFKTD